MQKSSGFITGAESFVRYQLGFCLRIYDSNSVLRQRKKCSDCVDSSTHTCFVDINYAQVITYDLSRVDLDDSDSTFWLKAGS